MCPAARASSRMLETLAPTRGPTNGDASSHTMNRPARHRARGMPSCPRAPSNSSFSPPHNSGPRFRRRNRDRHEQNDEQQHWHDSRAPEPLEREPVASHHSAGSPCVHLSRTTCRPLCGGVIFRSTASACQRPLRPAVRSEPEHAMPACRTPWFEKFRQLLIRAPVALSSGVAPLHGGIRDLGRSPDRRSRIEA